MSAATPPFPLPTTATRVVCFAMGGLTELLCTFPLLHSLRRHFRKAHVTLVCDPRMTELAQTCPAIDEVLPIRMGGFPLLTKWRNQFRLRGYTWALAATDGVEPLVGALARISGAPMRIGFERRIDRSSRNFTVPVALPEKNSGEHQVETLLRLLQPLGLVNRTGWAVDMSLNLPDTAKRFAEDLLTRFPFDARRPLMILHLSGNRGGPKLPEQDVIGLISRLLNGTDFTIALTGKPVEQIQAMEIAVCVGSDRVTALNTPGMLELAAVIEKAQLLLTPLGGAAHLAAAVNTAALILGDEMTLQRWRSRHPLHVAVVAHDGEKTIPQERIWQALQTMLPPIRA